MWPTLVSAKRKALIMEYLCSPTLCGYAWLIAALLLLLLEVGTPGLFYFLSFSAGAFGAAIVAFLGVNLQWQCITTICVALLVFFVLRHYFTPRAAKEAKTTNFDALLHQSAIVTEVIKPHSPGRVKIRGEEWLAITETGHVLQKGTLVTVQGLQGNKLIVT